MILRQDRLSWGEIAGNFHAQKEAFGRKQKCWHENQVVVVCWIMKRNRTKILSTKRNVNVGWWMYRDWQLETVPILLVPPVYYCNVILWLGPMLLAQCIGVRTIGTTSLWCSSRSAFGRSTGNDLHNLLFLFFVVYFSYRRSAWIKKLIWRKLTGTPQNLDPIGHFGAH